MLAFFSAFFGKTSIFFRFFLEKELLAFAVIFHDCDPDFSTQKEYLLLVCVDCLFPLHDVQSRTIGY